MYICKVLGSSAVEVVGLSLQCPHVNDQIKSVSNLQLLSGFSTINKYKGLTGKCLQLVLSLSSDPRMFTNKLSS